MTQISEYVWLKSEIAELEGMLSSMPKSDIINRKSCEWRIQEVKEKLDTLPSCVSPVIAQLTFRGKMVDGSRSIFVGFGTEALNAFSGIFQAVSAGLNRPIKTMGRVPDKDKNQLRIIGTAIGSFGFELELPQNTDDLFFSPEDAMQKIETLLQTSATGIDDDVADILSDIPERAVKSFSKFLDLLVQNESWCGLTFGGKTFRYENLEQVKRAANLLKDDNISEKNERFRGEFQGFLPAERTFEFKQTDAVEIMKGKIGAAISEPDILNRGWLYKPVDVTLCSVRVGNAKERYILQSLDDLTPNSGG